MVFDKGVRVLEGRKYEYVEDPTIDYAEAGNTGARKVPKGIPSGGINVTVVGSNFNYIQDPAMYIVYQEKRYVCSVFTVEDPSTGLVQYLNGSD